MNSISKNESSASLKDHYFKIDHLKKDLKVRAVKSGGIMIACRIGMYCIRMVSTIVLARLLVPKDFGLVAIVTAFAGFFYIFRSLGLTDATVQEEHLTHRQVSTLFWINLGFSMGISLVFICLSPLIAYFYNEPKLKMITILLSLSFTFAGLSTLHLAIVKRKMKFLKFAINEIIGTILSVIVAILVATYGYGYWALVFRQISLAAFTAIGAWVICRWRPGLPGRGTNVAPLIKFGANLVGFNFVKYLSGNVDKTLIGWKWAPTSLGYYHNAYHLFVAPINQFSVPLVSVAVATLSKLRSEPERFIKYYLKALSQLSFFCLPLSAFMTVMSREIILLLLGPQWDKSALIFSAFGLSMGILIIYHTNGWLHISLGKSERRFRWGIINSVFTVIGIVIGLPFGPLGVAVAYSAMIYLLFVPGFIYAGKPINLHFTLILNSIWKYYTSAFGAAAILLYITIQSFVADFQPWLRLFLGLLVFILIYLILIIALYQNVQPITQCLEIFKLFLSRKKSRQKDQRFSE